MGADVLLGLQWGDEGKGKIVDVLTPEYDIIARFQGGPNAGHTLEFDGIKHVLHTIPSGVFHPTSINLIGNGVVIDPIIFKKELCDLEKLNLNIDNKLLISRKAHLILPSHKLLDAASGFRGTKSKLYRAAKEAVDRSLRFAARDRKVKKRQFRSLWIVRISAAAKLNGISYNKLIHGLKQSGVELDRKVLADLAVRDPATFTKLVETVKQES